MTHTQPFVVTVADVCFCHWPVEASALARSVPDWLTVETAAGNAWVTAIPHTITGISAFGIDLARPAEAMTVRTYVRGPDGQRGLYFFAVIPEDRIGAAATPVLSLPVRQGRPTRYAPDSEGRSGRTVEMDGQRILDVRYEADAEDTTTTPPDSLASFLVERYRYFTDGPLGGRLVGSVGHDPWRLAPVDATVTGPLPSALGLPDPIGEPLCHYSPGAELSVGPPRPLWLT